MHSSKTIIDRISNTWLTFSIISSIISNSIAATPLPPISLHNSVIFSLSKTHGAVGEKKIFLDGIQKIVFLSIFEETLDPIPEIVKIFSMK